MLSSFSSQNTRKRAGFIVTDIQSAGWERFETPEFDTIARLGKNLKNSELSPVCK
jgi:hypothetical protein